MTACNDPTLPESKTRAVLLLDGVGFRVAAGGGRRAFWDSVVAGQWEPHTFTAFRRFASSTCSCIDFGSWIGPTVLYAARFARHVHAIEPDPIAHEELVANIILNPDLQARVTVYSHCIAPGPGPVSLYSGGMFYNARSQFGDSMSGIVPAPGCTGQPSRIVDGIPLADFMATNGVTDCRLIKMDIEGGEYELIPGRWRQLAAFGMPTLFVSFHSPGQSRRQELIGTCLEELRHCYKWLYRVQDQTLVDEGEVEKTMDWTDESPGSPLRNLELMLFHGVVASNELW